ncbi:MAG: SprT family zinc-dependent metalloprotease [Patescibacteria group bacterium]
MSIRIREAGVVELVLPLRASERAGNAFVQSRHSWIARALSVQKKREGLQKPVVWEHGAAVPCFGDTLQLSIVCKPNRTRSTVSLRGPALVVNVANMSQVHKALSTWYRREAEAYCIGQVQEYADVLGVSFSSIRAIHMKSQWGSCNSKTKALTFNWKLALAPEEIARYVIAHEVAHLVQANHSKAFWNVVIKLDADYMLHRKWLKVYGGGLYIR